MDAAIGGLEKPFAAVIKRVRIVWRDHHRGRPLKTVLEIRRAPGIGKFRLLGDRLHLSDTLVETRDVSLIVRRVNNIWIRRVWRNITSLASTHVIPVAAINRSIVAAAGNGYSSAILLCAVNAVRRSVVRNHV